MKLGFIVAFAALTNAGEVQAGPIPKYGRSSDLAYALNCEVARLTSEAIQKGVKVLSVKGTLTIKKVDKSSSSVGIAATLPFDVFEFAPSVSASEANSAERSVVFDIIFDPKRPIPSDCKGFTVATYSQNEKLNGSVIAGQKYPDGTLKPLIDMEKLFKQAPDNKSRPGTYEQGASFVAETKVDTGFSIKILFLKISATPKMQNSTASLAYSITWKTQGIPFQK